MKILFYCILLHFLLQLTQQQGCFSTNTECLFCDYQSYSSDFAGLMAGMNAGSTCLAKTQQTITKNYAVLSNQYCATIPQPEICANTNSITAQTDITIQQVFHNIPSALLFIYEEATRYQNSQIQLFLLGYLQQFKNQRKQNILGTHHTILLNDFGSSYTKKKLFRKTLIDLTIKPLYCSQYQNVPQCQSNSTQKAVLNVKTQNFQFYVSKMLTIENLQFDGTESAFLSNAESAPDAVDNQKCYNRLDQSCCTTQNLIDGTDDCKLYGQTIPDLSFTYDDGIFVMDHILECIGCQVPQLKIIKSDFQYFNSINNPQLYTNNALISLKFPISKINIDTVTISKSFFQKGIIFQDQQTLTQDPIYIPVSGFQQSLLNGQILFSSNVLTLKDTSIENYNDLSMLSHSQNEGNLFNFVLVGQLTTQNLIIDVVNQFSTTQKIFQLSNLQESTININFKNINEVDLIQISGSQIIGGSLHVLNSVFSRTSTPIDISSTSIIFDLISFDNVLRNQATLPFLKTSISSSITIQSGLIKNTTNIQLSFDTNLNSIVKNTYLQDSSLSSQFLFVKENSILIDNLQVIRLNAKSGNIIQMQGKNLTLINSQVLDSIAKNVFKISTVEEIMHRGCVFQNLNLTKLWDSDITYRNLIVENTKIIHNTMENLLESFKISALTNGIFFKNSEITNNFFNHKGASYYAIGLNNQFISFENSIMAYNMAQNAGKQLFDNKVKYLFLLDLDSKVIMRNSQFLYNGIEVDANDRAFIKFFDAKTFECYNSILINGLGYTLSYGLIFAYNMKQYVKSDNCTYQTISDQPQLYSGINILSGTLIEFTNNKFIGMKCSNRDFMQANGVLGIFQQTAYSRSSKANKAVVTGNQFINSTCKFGGAIAIVGYNDVTVSNNLFQNSYAEDTGGSILGFGSDSFTFSDNIVTNSIVQRQGSVAYFKSITDLDISKIQITNCQGSTGAFHIASVIQCSMNDVIVQNSAASSSGGFLYADAIDQANLQNIYLQNISATEIGGAVFAGYKVSLSLTNVFTQDTRSNQGGFMFVKGAINITVNNMTNLNSLALLGGSVIFIDEYEDLFQINSMNTQNCIAQDSNGIINLKSLITSSKLNIVQLACISNTAFQGSCLYLESLSTINVGNLYIQNCSGSAIKAQQYQEIPLQISNIVLKDSKSLDNLIAIQSYALNFNNILLENNIADQDLISLQNSAFAGDQLILKENLQNKINNIQYYGVKAQGKSITINNFQSYYADIETPLTNQKGQVKPMTINNVQLFINLVHIEGSQCDYHQQLGLIDLKLSYANIQQGLFQKNKGLNIKAYNSNLTLNNSNFFNNSINVLSSNDEYPVEIAISSDISNNWFKLDINNSNLISNQGNMIISSNVRDICINNSQIKSMGLNSTLQAIKSKNVKNILVSNSLIQGFNGNKGSFLESISSIQSSSILQNNMITQCTSQIGGAIYLSGLNILNSQQNSYIQNQAVQVNSLENDKGIAGVIYQDCYDTINCVINSINDTFKDNFAQQFSPTIFSKSKIIQQTAEFINNSDYLKFTSEISDFPNNVVHINNTEYYKINTNQNLQSQPNDVVNITSGWPFTLYFKIIDNRLNTLIYDNQSTAKFMKNINVSNSVVIINGLTQAQQGLFIFKDIIVKTNPNSSFVMDMNIEIILRNKDIIQITKKLLFNVRECFRGELKMVDNSCVRCSEGFYLKSDPMDPITTDKVCKKCDDNAICPGGFDIFAKPKYYITDNMSEYLVPCLNSESCMLITNNQTTPVSYSNACNEKYEGKRCQNCKYKYGRESVLGECVPCASSIGDYYVKAVLVILISIAYIFFFVNKYTEKPKVPPKKQDYEAQIQSESLQKIIINHMQATSLIMIPVDWKLADIVKSLDGILGSFNVASKELFTSDCMVQQYFVASPSEIQVIKSTLSFIAPLFVTAIFLILYSLVQLVKGKFDFMKIFVKTAVFMCILVQFLYMMLLKSSLEFLDCFSLNPQKPDLFLRIDASVLCGGEQHTQILNNTVFPGIVLWGLIYPLMFYFALTYQQKVSISIKSSTVSDKTMNDQILNYAQKKGLKLQIQDKNRGSLKFSENKEIEMVKDKKSGKLMTEGESNLETVQTHMNKEDFRHYKKKIMERKSFINNVEFNEQNEYSSVENFFITLSLGFQYFQKNYQEKFYFWEAIIFIRKLLLSVLAVVIQEIFVKQILCIAYFCILTTVDLQLRPYKHRFCNLIEIFSFLLCILLIFAQIVLNIYKSDDYILLQYAGSIIYIFINSLYILYVLKHIGGHKLKVFLNKCRPSQDQVVNLEDSSSHNSNESNKKQDINQNEVNGKEDDELIPSGKQKKKNSEYIRNINSSRNERVEKDKVQYQNLSKSQSDSNSNQSFNQSDQEENSSYTNSKKSRMLQSNI